MKLFIPLEHFGGKIVLSILIGITGAFGMPAASGCGNQDVARDVFASGSGNEFKHNYFFLVCCLLHELLILRFLGEYVCGNGFC